MTALMEYQEQTQILIDQAKAGDRSAFSKLVESTRDRLEAVIRSSLNPAIEHIVDLEEVLQETVVRGFESIQSFEWQGDDSFSAWLRGIARHSESGTVKADAEGLPRKSLLSRGPKAFCPWVFGLSTQEKGE